MAKSGIDSGLETLLLLDGEIFPMDNKNSQGLGKYGTTNTKNLQ